MQEISNTLAKLSVYACARLGGYLLNEEDTTPDNPAIKKSLSAMLTPYLAKKLADNSPHEVWSHYWYVTDAVGFLLYLFISFVCYFSTRLKAYE